MAHIEEWNQDPEGDLIESRDPRVLHTGAPGRAHRPAAVQLVVHLQPVPLLVGRQR